MATNALRAARQARGWSQAEAARALADAAGRRGEGAATAASLKTLLSRWENGHSVPDPGYRDLLADLYGCAVTDLGLAPPEPAPDPAARLRAGVGTAAAVDPAVLRGWIGQLTLAHGLDGRLGPSGTAAGVDDLLHRVEQAHAYGCRLPGLAPLRAEVLLLAGTHALDAADPDTAFVRFGRAREIALVLGLRTAAVLGPPEPAVPVPVDPDPPGPAEDAVPAPVDAGLLAARAAVGQAAALLDAGAPGLAIALLTAAARDRGAAGGGPAAVLAAAEARAHAAAGDGAATRSALGRAWATVPRSGPAAAGPARAGEPVGTGGSVRDTRPGARAAPSARAAQPPDADAGASTVPTVDAAVPVPTVDPAAPVPLVDAAVPTLLVEVEVAAGAGHALAVLRDPAGYAPLTAVLAAAAGLRRHAEAHADLATLLRAAGRGEEADRHARKARDLAERGGVRRVLHRLAATAG